MKCSKCNNEGRQTHSIISGPIEEKDKFYWCDTCKDEIILGIVTDKDFVSGRAMDFNGFGQNIEYVGENQVRISDGSSYVDLNGIALTPEIIEDAAKKAMDQHLTVKTSSKETSPGFFVGHEVRDYDDWPDGEPEKDNDLNDDLVTLSGVAENSRDLGTFNGTVIPDNATTKEALQALETAHQNSPNTKKLFLGPTTQYEILDKMIDMVKCIGGFENIEQPGNALYTLLEVVAHSQAQLIEQIKAAYDDKDYWDNYS